MLQLKSFLLAAVALAGFSFAQSPEDAEWLESVGWDGTVIPIEEIGTPLYNETWTSTGSEPLELQVNP